jgi:hypothetical protein
VVAAHEGERCPDKRPQSILVGTYALEITGAHTRQLADDLGYPTKTMQAYQGVGAVATANAFILDGVGGHFAWCIAQLSRAGILGALGA